MSDIVDMYAGNTEKNLHNAFETARKNTPCILFFDEIDGIAGKREGMDQGFEKRAINQFLLEMDGAEYSNDGILAIGATNAPWDIDAALRRSGRFAKMIYLGEPDTKTRADLIKIALRKRPYVKNLPIGRIARMTEGYSSADCAEIVESAATIPWLEAINTGKERLITFKDFLKVTSGEDAVTPSLPAWYGSVKKKLIKDSDDEDDQYSKGFMRGIFMDIISTAPPDSQQSEGSRGHTVKHKQEQKGLVNDEERRQFSSIIKDIEKRTDGSYLMWKRAKIMFARYIA
jgi:SpoVK/Ycf46/Vps4 family AAA+-type ATPase